MKPLYLKKATQAQIPLTNPASGSPDVVGKHHIIMRKINQYINENHRKVIYTSLPVSILLGSCKKDCLKSIGINGIWIWTKSTGFWNYNASDCWIHTKTRDC
jgi:hypothetical protein